LCRKTHAKIGLKNPEPLTWRRAGLVVDEDFERGISSCSRLVRTGLLILFIVLVALGAGATMESTRFDFTRLRVHPARHPVRSLERMTAKPVRAQV
jgi:hypothetical protein